MKIRRSPGINHPHTANSKSHLSQANFSKLLPGHNKRGKSSVMSLLDWDEGGLGGVCVCVCVCVCVYGCTQMLLYKSRASQPSETLKRKQLQVFFLPLYRCTI